MKRKLLSAIAILGCAFAAFGQGALDPNEGTTLARNPSDGSYTFSWWGRAGRTYFLQTCDDLVSGTWTYLPIVESGSDSIIQWGFTSNSSSFFLQLKYTDDPPEDLWQDALGADAADAWQNYYFGYVGAVDPFGDEDGDGVTNIQEFLAGTSPIKFTLSKGGGGLATDGDGQSGPRHTYLQYPATVTVTNGAGNPVVGAEVVFSVNYPDDNVFALDATGNTEGGSYYTAVTGSTGKATAYVKTGSTPGAVTITATYYYYALQKVVTFTETTLDQTTIPNAPTNLAVETNADGSYDIYWDDNANDEDYFFVEVQNPDGTWTRIATLPPNTTYYHVPPPGE